MLCRTHPVKFYGQIFNVVLAFRNLGYSARLQRAQSINVKLFNDIPAIWTIQRCILSSEYIVL